CWGRCNRSALVRVPLGWTAGADMTAIANPGETGVGIDTAMKQTFELRSPDASADIYLLMAGLAVACRHGWEMAEALDLADATYVDVNIHSGENASRAASLKTLPGCCAESAVCLRDKRGTFEAMGVFRPSLIDMTAAALERYGDTTLRDDIARDHALMQRLVGKYFHCG
ncbi:MAG: glutamine synthetase, partial [Duncaniella sp.]|nr:glutamine synthetase [Duncaniella sp.]